MLHIFTFLTDESRIEYLRKTAEINSVEINYINNDRWNGYIDKIEVIKNAIENIPDNDIVCFIDAYDVLVNNNISTILENFQTYNCDVLFGAELNCYPDIYRDKFPPNHSGTKYNYVNSGGYIGFRHALKRIFEWKSINEIYNICTNGGDQTYFIEYFLENHSDKIKLDEKCIIFQNMHLVSWKEIEFIEGKMVNTILKTTPCFIHFNGGTFQQNNRENIMPVFIEKMNEHNNQPSNLNEYEQIVTSTCYPHPQV